VSWQAASFVLLGLALAGGFAWYERDKPPARVLALVAALAALAVVGRLAFAAIPNVKPTTDIVLFAGYALGGAPGFAVGAVTAIVSNIFLSQGPWTAWQMAGWGAVGVGGAMLARAAGPREPNRFALAAACALAGLAFGAWMDVYQWTLAARQDFATYVAVSGTSLPYNLAHAIGNFVFCLVIGPVFVRSLRRYRRRLEVRWDAAPAGTGIAAAALAALAVAGGVAGDGGVSASAAARPKADAAATASGRAVRYLLRAQNRDGGFGAAPGQRSTPLYSGWSAIGLAAAGRNPRDVLRRGGRSIASYVRSGARALRDVGEIERTILVLGAAGLSPRTFGGRDLVAQVERRRRGDGSIAGFVSYTAFGILALRAADEPAGRRTIAWLVSAQNADGGFGVAPSSASDSDMTGAALQALAVTGRAGTAAARRAVAYLRGNQSADGGFGQMRGRSSNSQSTAYAVQGLVAVDAARDSVERALVYLTRLQRADGSIAYSSTSSQTPVWVTAQALAALRREPLPLAAAPRERAGARRPRETAPARSPQPDAKPRRDAEAPAAAGGEAATGKPATGDAPADARAGARNSRSQRKAAGASRQAGGAAALGGAPEVQAAEVQRGAQAAGKGPNSTGGGVPAGVLLGAGAVTLGLLVLLRRRLVPRRLRRPRATQ
jgi:Squalene-hopene cyclase C-terminal domain/Prenyltransferase and squalene oxidase repeat